jgi:hypothetical protein
MLVVADGVNQPIGFVRFGVSGRRAYHRAAYWDERIRMAQWWATEIEAIRVEGQVHY